VSSAAIIIFFPGPIVSSNLILILCNLNKKEGFPSLYEFKNDNIFVVINLLPILSPL
jgi:hypothetical protein